MHSSRSQSALQRSISPENQRHQVNMAANGDTFGSGFAQGYSTSPYQSTPIKKQNSGTNLSYGWHQKGYSPAKPQAAMLPSPSTNQMFSTSLTNVTMMTGRSPSPTKVLLTGSQSPTKGTDMEASTIQRQRRELQLMMNELKDRDRELNEMVDSHQKQLISWETDRQRVLVLEKQISRYKVELKKRQDQVRTLKEKLKLTEQSELAKAKDLESTQMRLQRVSDQANVSLQQIHELKDSNENMASSIQELSTSLGQLQAKEQELLTSVKLKDNDIREANTRLNELSKQARTLQASLQESRKTEANLRAEKDQWKEQYAASKHEVEKLRFDIDKQYNHADVHQAELSQIKQELLAVQKELFLAGEREKRKDQLVELSKSKQERTETELQNIRQLYERQQRDYVFLQQQTQSRDIDISDRMSDINTEDDISEIASIGKYGYNHIDDALTNLDVFSLKEADRNYELKGGNADFFPNYYDNERSQLGASQNRRLASRSGINVSNSNVVNNSDHSGSTIGSLVDTVKGHNTSSPTERLHKLLAESRHMVDSLDENSPFSSPKSSPDSKDVRNRTTEESMQSTPLRNTMPPIKINSFEEEV